jgi:hypothetical protein
MRNANPPRGFLTVGRSVIVGRAFGKRGAGLLFIVCAKDALD